VLLHITVAVGHAAATAGRTNTAGTGCQHSAGIAHVAVFFATSNFVGFVAAQCSHFSQCVFGKVCFGNINVRGNVAVFFRLINAKANQLTLGSVCCPVQNTQLSANGQDLLQRSANCSVICRCPALCKNWLGDIVVAGGGHLVLRKSIFAGNQ